MGPFSAIYRAMLSCRSLFYSYIKKPGKLPAKVISIGNITLGGTGKTPAVIAVAEGAKMSGLNPCILTRGYKGKIKGPCFASKGSELLLDPDDAGDEARLMAERLNDVPVVIGKNRYDGGMFALNSSNFQPSLFILDDGFQHIALHRDIDVLLIDASNPFGSGRLFPEGRLREPLKSMGRADIIVITKADMASKISIEGTVQKIKKYNSTAPIYHASHKPTALVSSSGQVMDLETLKEKKVYLFSGIANPSYFKAILDSIGVEVVRFKNFRDHHNYRQREIDRIVKSAAGMGIITTEKDMVKLKSLKNTENISALRIEFSVEDEFYNKLFEEVSTIGVQHP